MAPRNVNRAAKSAPPGRTKRRRASKETENTPPGSDGVEESTTQAIQFEEDEIAEDIKNTKSKLNELQDPNGTMEQWARGFLNQQKEDKVRVMADLDVGGVSMTKKKESHENELLEYLSAALSLIEQDAAPIQLSKPLDRTQIAQILAVEQPLYQQSQFILGESYALIKAYNDLAGKNMGPSSLDQLEAAFRRDCEHTSNVLAAGKKVAKSEIEDMMADRYNEVRGRRALTEDEAKLGKEVFDSAEQDADIVMSDTEGWGEVAYKTSRAARKMPVLAVGMRD